MPAPPAKMDPACSWLGNRPSRPHQRKLFPVSMDYLPRELTACSRLTDGVIAAWKARCGKIEEDERRNFESRACRGLAEYLAELANASQAHRDESRAFRFIDWFEPLYTAVELFMPAATVAIQAYPNPGSLILGGVIAALQATQRLRDYHKLTVQLLARMGRKAHILQAYETVVYKSDDQIQKALVEVYGDIIDFCQNAVKLATKHKKTIVKVKGLMMSIFKDFEAQLGSLAEGFETHVEELEALGRLRDKKRLKDLHDSLNARFTATSEINGDNKEQLERLNAAMEQLLKRNREIQTQEDHKTKEHHRGALLNWLSPMNVATSYDQRCEEHLDGTGSWMLQSEVYRNWKSSDTSDLLWVRGKPGCGKSVLAAVTITDLKLEVEPETALGYAFCRRDEESSQDSTAIFGALAKQVSTQTSKIHPVLESECRASNSASKPSRRAIRQIMTSVVKEFKRIYLVVDALDECNNQEDLAQELRDLVENKGLPTVKVIVFSRTEYKIVQRLGGYKQIEPDQGANEEDLKAYIRSLFPKTDDKKVVNQKIRKECFAKAGGMFQWVQLLAKHLDSSCLPDKEKLKLIQDIPPGLDSIYDRILLGIYRQAEYSRTTAFLVLLWIMFSGRPLTRVEMLDAVADYSEARKLKEASKYDKAEHLVAICANLVFIDRDGCFRLCHESVRNYLDKFPPEPAHPLSEFKKQKQNAHQRLAEICLNYMLLDDFERGALSSASGLFKLAERKPFLDYASNWHLHVREENATALHGLIMKCINSQPRRELSMQFALLRNGEVEATAIWKYIGSSNPLHLLAIFGLKQIAVKVADVVSLALEADGSGKTPLAYAVERRHHDMAVWLTEQIQNAPGQLLSPAQTLSLVHSAAEHGWADLLESLLSRNKDHVDSKMSPDGDTPLGQACRFGWKDAAETLIRHQACVNLVDGKGDYPLLLAAINGHADIARMLLAHDADPNCYDPEGWSPLHYAADIGNAEIATALLERNADPLATVPDGKRRTPLVVAAYRNSVEVVAAFYRWNPRLVTEAKPVNGWNPLHGAAFHDSHKTLRYLLDKGIEKDALTEDNERETALSIAAAMGFLDSAKVLVDAGCDPSLPDATGKNSLHAAARSGKLQIVQHVLNKQPRGSWHKLVNHRADNGETPLHSAVYGENPDIVALLLERGSNPPMDETEDSVSSPLHWAAERGLTMIAATLLRHTKDANPRDSAGETPLHCAARAGKLQFIVLFIQDAVSLGLCVDVNARSKMNSTALHTALLDGFENVAEFLLEQGAVSLCNNGANYPVHLAAWQGCDSIVERLIPHEGAGEPGYFGRTPLHCAAHQGHLSTAKLLTAHSTNVINVPDQENNTPVYSALLRRHLDVAHHLLDLGVDISGTSEHEEGLLHIAVGISDLPMVKRLLGLGLRGDQKNLFGTTPLHQAASTGSTEILDALVAAGCSGVNIQDSLGNSPAMYAAENGSLAMLRKLDDLGASWQLCSHLGCNAAHFAVGESSHPDVLLFLSSRGVDLGLADVDGETPLMNAASRGNAAAVSYLLQTQSHAVDQRVPFKDSTALICAAKYGGPRCVQLLLAAGADPHLRDMYGNSALDYAAFHRPCLREMHNAHHLRVPIDTKMRRKILSNLICQLGQMIQQCSGEPANRRVALASHLSCALLQVGDFDAARIPLIEILWPPKFAATELYFTCCVCQAEKSQGDKYVCQTCLDWTCMCKACHTEFEKAKDKTPDCLKDVLELENRMLPVRLAVLPQTSLWVVCDAMRGFVAGCEWTRTVVEEYELWEQTHNSDKRFDDMKRPGQELLKLAMDAAQFLERGASSTDLAEIRNAATQLEERYEKFSRQHGFIKDPAAAEFRCEGHTFMSITEIEAKDVKAAGIDIGPDGRTTVSYLQNLIEKYREPSTASRAASFGTSNGSSGSISQEGSSTGGRSNGTPHRTTENIDTSGARPLQRSLTLAARLPSKRIKSLRLPPIRLPSIEPGRDVKLSPQFSPVDTRGIRRVQTLPAGHDEDLASPFLISNKKLRSELGSAINWFSDLSVKTDVGVIAAAANRDAKSPPPDIMEENRSTNEASLVQIALRLVLAGVANSESLLSFTLNPDPTIRLAFTLHVTAVMVPSFVDIYIATQKDDRDFEREVEAAPGTSSGTSEADSDSDEGGTSDESGGEVDDSGEE